MTIVPIDLAGFGVTAELGFLPKDPLQRLSLQFTPLEKALEKLPELLAKHEWGTAAEAIPMIDSSKLRHDEWRRAHSLLAYAASGYVLENVGHKQGARTRIPANIAVPLAYVSDLLGRPPILNYDGYCLSNWRRIKNGGPIALGNIDIMTHFVDGAHRRDEAWFILVHVEIEACAGGAIAAAVRALKATADNDPRACEAELFKIHHALKNMNAVMARMPEQCDPQIYLPHVRPWIWGWMNNPNTPEGVVYEGVDRYAGMPQKFRGETGAQSSIMPFLDDVFEVFHMPSNLSDHLTELRAYMPRGHRRLIDAVEDQPSLRQFVSLHRSMYEIYNECLIEMWKFRTRHYQYAHVYIFNHETSTSSKGGPHAVGTGGTSFRESLRKHLQETLEALLY